MFSLLKNDKIQLEYFSFFVRFNIKILKIIKVKHKIRQNTVNKNLKTTLLILLQKQNKYIFSIFILFSVLLVTLLKLKFKNLL